MASTTKKVVAMTFPFDGGDAGSFVGGALGSLEQSIDEGSASLCGVAGLLASQSDELK